jgi:hypothetical protein
MRTEGDESAVPWDMSPPSSIGDTGDHFLHAEQAIVSDEECMDENSRPNRGTQSLREVREMTEQRIINAKRDGEACAARARAEADDVEKQAVLVENRAAAELETAKNESEQQLRSLMEHIADVESAVPKTFEKEQEEAQQRVQLASDRLSGIQKSAAKAIQIARSPLDKLLKSVEAAEKSLGDSHAALSQARKEAVFYESSLAEAEEAATAAAEAAKWKQLAEDAQCEAQQVAADMESQIKQHEEDADATLREAEAAAAMAIRQAEHARSEAEKKAESVKRTAIEQIEAANIGKQEQACITQEQVELTERQLAEVESRIRHKVKMILADAVVAEEEVKACVTEAEESAQQQVLEALEGLQSVQAKAANAVLEAQRKFELQEARTQASRDEACDAARMAAAAKSSAEAAGAEAKRCAELLSATQAQVPAIIQQCQEEYRTAQEAAAKATAAVHEATEYKVQEHRRNAFAAEEKARAAEDAEQVAEQSLRDAQQLATERLDAAKKARGEAAGAQEAKAAEIERIVQDVMERTQKNQTVCKETLQRNGFMQKKM